jgi:hypothetical protein
MQGGKLTGRAQKQRLEDCVPGMLRELSALRQSGHPIREIEHLVEIDLEEVPLQG